MRFYSYETQRRVNEIPKKSGKGTKSPNINDAIQMHLRPSTTEIINIVSKPMLLSWLQEQAFDSAWNSAATPISRDEAWAYYMKKSSEVRDLGSDLHDKISRLELSPLTSPVIKWIQSNYSPSEHEVQFCHDLYGGTIDMLGTQRTSGKIDLVDFKSVKKNRDPYPQECQQLSAYRDWAVKNGRPIHRCINIYFSQETGEILNVKEWTQQEIDNSFQVFLATCKLWQYINNYNILLGKPVFE